MIDLLSIIESFKNIKQKKNTIISKIDFDVILISNLLTSNKKKNNDLYFKGVSNILKKKKIKYLKVFINNL